MFKEKNMLYILTMLESIEKIFIYCKGIKDSKEFFNKNEQLIFNAVINLLIAIGEENKKIDNDLKDNSTINWKDISAMRDKISHNYRGIDEDIVWNILEEYLPKLKTELVKMISQIDNYKTLLDKTLNSHYYKHLEYLKKLV